MQLFWYRLKEQFWAGQDRWGLWLPFFFACGIGIYFMLPVEPSKWATLAVIELLIVLAVLLRYRIRWLYALIVPAAVVAGFAVIQLRTLYLATEQAPVPAEKLYLQGRIEHLDYNSRGNRRMILGRLTDFDGNPVPGRFRVSMRPQPGKLYSGQCVELVAKLMPLASASLPGGYQFDRKSFYLGLSGSGYSESRVLPVDCREPASWRERFSFKVAGWRQSIMEKIKRILPPDEASVASAVIAGEQTGINSRLIQNYRDSGLAHFLSISGLHMSMLAGLMFFFIRLLMALIPPLTLRCDSKKVSAVFALLISVVYLLISGAAIPAQRAFIMTFIVLLGVLLDRRAISMKTIAWAAFLVLLITPEALVGASFQMSFAAVIALIAFYERFAGTLKRFLDGKGTSSSLIVKTFKIVFLYIVGILVSDLVASLATLPFSVYHFNRIALFTTLANLMAGPIIGLLIMPFTLFSLLLMPLGLEYWPLRLVGYGIRLVNDITAYVSSLPSAGYQVLSMPLWGLLLMVFGGLWLAIWQTSWRKWGWLFVVGGLLSVFTVRTPDILVNAEQDLIALRDNRGHLVVMPKRGDNFTKQVWLDKTASPRLDKKRSELLRKIYKGRTASPQWLELSCRNDDCVYRRRFSFNRRGQIRIDSKPLAVKEGLGAAVYLNPLRIVTVRDYIGRRPWNSGL